MPFLMKLTVYIFSNKIERAADFWRRVIHEQYFTKRFYKFYNKNKLEK